MVASQLALGYLLGFPRPPSGPFYTFRGLKFFIKLSSTKKGALFIPRLLGIIVSGLQMSLPVLPEVACGRGRIGSVVGCGPNRPHQRK